MPVPDDQSATAQTAEHYRRYCQQLARKGFTKKSHAISTKNNIEVCVHSKRIPRRS